MRRCAAERIPCETRQDRGRAARRRFFSPSRAFAPPRGTHRSTSTDAACAVALAPRTAGGGVVNPHDRTDAPLLGQGKGQPESKRSSACSISVDTRPVRRQGRDQRRPRRLASGARYGGIRARKRPLRHRPLTPGFTKTGSRRRSRCRPGVLLLRSSRSRKRKAAISGPPGPRTSTVVSGRIQLRSWAVGRDEGRVDD